MCCFERLYACAVPYICCGILYCRRVVLIIAMLCLVSCELFLKALFTCVFQVELIKVSTQRGPCFACNMDQCFPIPNNVSLYHISICTVEIIPLLHHETSDVRL